MSEFIANAEQELPKKEGQQEKYPRLVVDNIELTPNSAVDEIRDKVITIVRGNILEKHKKIMRGGRGTKGDPEEIKHALDAAKDAEERLRRDMQKLQRDKEGLIALLAELRMKEQDAEIKGWSSTVKNHIKAETRHVLKSLQNINTMLPEANPKDDHRKILNIIERYRHYERQATKAGKALAEAEHKLESNPGDRKLAGEANRAKIDLVAAEGEMRVAAEEAKKIEGSDTSRPYQNDGIRYTHQASQGDAADWKKKHGKWGERFGEPEHQGENIPDAGEKVAAGVLGMTEEVRRSRANLNKLNVEPEQENAAPAPEIKPAEIMATVPADTNPDERLVLEVEQGTAELPPTPSETGEIEKGKPAEEGEQRILRTMAEDIALAEKDEQREEPASPKETIGTIVNSDEAVAKMERMITETEPNEEAPVGTVVNSDEGVAKMEQMLAEQDTAEVAIEQTPAQTETTTEGAGVNDWQEKAVEDSGIKTPDWELAPKESPELELVPIETKGSLEMTDEDLQKLRAERMEAFNSLFGINGKALTDGTIIAKEMEALDARAAKSGMRMLERVRGVGEKWNKLPAHHKWLLTAGMLTAGSGAALAGSAVAVGAVGGMRLALSAAGGAGAFAAIENILKTAHENKTGEPRTEAQENRHTLLAALAATVLVGVTGSRVFDMMADTFGGEGAAASETAKLGYTATPEVMSEEVGETTTERPETLEHATTPETTTEETTSSTETPQATPQNTFTPDNPYVLQYADQLVSSDMQKLFGQKGMLGFGVKPWNEVLDISDPKVGFASKTVSEVLNVETSGVTDESMQHYGIQNDAAVGKMRDYIENTMKKSGVLPAPDEKLFDFLKRAAAKKISEVVSTNG